MNISRSRKGFVPTEVLSTAASTSFSGSSAAGSGKVLGVDSQTAANIVRFSGNVIKLLTFCLCFKVFFYLACQFEVVLFSVIK